MVRKKFSILIALSLCLVAAPLWAGLQAYLRKPEPEFEWRLNKIESEHGGDRIYDLELVSQNWQNSRWRHQLQVYRPQNAPASPTMFLWVTGGSARPEYVFLGMELARKVKAPVALLYHVPNQPLLDGDLREDELIAETFVRYLKTEDETWPLLFPMVKSVVKGMDVLQAFGKGELEKPIHQFIVAGASKRGWTTWLTAAVDRRVSAIAPVVIDTLNLREQMARQLEAFGAYSVMLTPYRRRGLLPIPETPAAQRLLGMVDPWVYRERLTMPKLIVNGTNDPYWATGALNLYWNGVPNDKWVYYIPNAGHNLRRQDRPRSEQMSDLINALAAFSRHQASGTPMPKLDWKHENANDKLRLTISAAPAPRGARLWVAEAPTRDFRKAKWNDQPLGGAGGKIVGELSAPEGGYLAFFGELDYEIDGLKYHLSTQLRTTE